MPIVAIDSNIVDLLLESSWTPARVDAAEALAAPPPLDDVADIGKQRELWACYWLRALSYQWTATVYTFSDMLLVENAAAASKDPGWARELLTFAHDVRDDQPVEYRTVDPTLTPSVDDVVSIGVNGRMDAQHVADAIGTGCDVLLTNDRRLRNCSPMIEARWALRIRRPSEFLIEAVRSGAPWPVGVPWPWESAPGS